MNRMVVIVPCGASKRTEPCTAGDMYVGAMHQLARKAAAAIAVDTNDEVLILSAKHGLLSLTAWLEPYEQQIGRPGAIGTDMLRLQAEQRDLANATVIALLPKAYSAALRAAGIRIDNDVLAGSRTMGEQRQRLARMARYGTVSV